MQFALDVALVPCVYTRAILQAAAPARQVAATPLSATPTGDEDGDGGSDEVSRSF